MFIIHAVVRLQRHAEVFDYSKITEKSGVITDYWTNNLLDLILRKDNLNRAYKQVKGSLFNVKVWMKLLVKKKGPYPFRI